MSSRSRRRSGRSFGVSVVVGGILLGPGVGCWGPPPVATPELVLPAQPAGPPGPSLAAPVAPTAATKVAAGPLFDRDLRAFQRRAPGVVADEISSLEKLLAATPIAAGPAGDRPALLKRLAERYGELAAAADDEPTRSTAQKAAIGAYRRLRAEHPTFAGDEAAYYSGLAYERLGETANAKKQYLELVTSYPASPLRPYVYLAFGEMFADQAVAEEGKWELAAQAYREVAKYPPPQNTAYGYAHYRLGNVEANLGNFLPAMSDMKKAIDFGAQYPEVPSSARVGAEARRAMVPLYAVAGDPRRAFDFFAALERSPARVPAALAMVEALALEYLAKEKLAELSTLAQTAAAHDPARACLWSSRSTNAEAALRQRTKLTREALDAGACP